MTIRRVAIPLALLVLASAAAAADGLAARSGETLWPRWQARLTNNAAPVSMAITSGRPTSLLLGDYFFNAPGFGIGAGAGAFRASTGLVLGSRGVANGLFAPEITPESFSSLPYIGLGYSGLSAKGGWGINADIGLVAEYQAGAIGLGRALFGNQGRDGAWRELRLSPLLQVGVHYAF